MILQLAADAAKPDADYWAWFNIISLVLTVIAFGIAVYQVRQATQQSHELGRHEESLRQIAASLSTRYLGVFPDYLTTAIEVAGRAKTELLVVTGNPTPAYFSDPKIWAEYRHAIAMRIHSGVQVSLVSMTEHQRMARVRNEFEKAEADWPGWCAKNEKTLETFLAHRYPNEAAATLTCERFEEMLIETQSVLTHELFGGSAHSEVDSAIVLQVWIADRNEAVFSIETLSEESLSHGLYTSDPKFISALHALAGLYRYT